MGWGGEAQSTLRVLVDTVPGVRMGPVRMHGSTCPCPCGTWDMCALWSCETLNACVLGEAWFLQMGVTGSLVSEEGCVCVCVQLSLWKGVSGVMCDRVSLEDQHGENTHMCRL